MPKVSERGLSDTAAVLEKCAPSTVRVSIDVMFIRWRLEYEYVNLCAHTRVCARGNAGMMARPRVVVVNMRQAQDSRRKEAVQREKEGEMKAAGCGMKLSLLLRGGVAFGNRRAKAGQLTSRPLLNSALGFAFLACCGPPGKVGFPEQNCAPEMPVNTESPDPSRTVQLSKVNQMLNKVLKP